MNLSKMTVDECNRHYRVGDPALFEPPIVMTVGRLPLFRAPPG
jgi:hypothetical protein